MSVDFISGILTKSPDVKEFKWQSDDVVKIIREGRPDFRAVILRKKLVKVRDIEDHLDCPDIPVIVNFPKIGMWGGEAIESCEDRSKAWGRFGVLLRALSMDDPENSEDPEISFSRRILSQHSRVKSLGFDYDHLLRIKHDTGRVLRVGLIYEYDLTADDVRTARSRLGEFDILLKTNPNGTILSGVHEAAESIGAEVHKIGSLMSYLAKLK